MADYASRRTMMVDTQVRPSDVTKFPIIDAMLSVPREQYVPAEKRPAAYMGGDVDLGEGRVLLDPRVFAKMLDALDIQPDEVVLDVGCALGYSTAVLASLAEFVVAVEENALWAEEAQGTLSAQNVDNAAVFEGALTEGVAKSGPYHVIILQGGIEALPKALDDQLQEGGRVCAIFMDGGLGVVRIGVKIGGRLNWRDLFNATAPVLPSCTTPKIFAL